jgi:hypothetical protein
MRASDRLDALPVEHIARIKLEVYMVRKLFTLLFLILLAITSSAYAQREREGETSRPPRTPKPKPKPKPRGSTQAQNISNGVLFVLTDPPTANVVIKARGGVVEQGRSKEGQYRAELPPGLYDIEVTSENYKPFSVKATVKQIGTEPVEAELVPTTGSILIDMPTVVPDVIILLDGQKPARVKNKTGKQIEIEDVPVGEHALRITHPSITDWNMTVAVGGGEPTRIAARFDPATANLIVKSEPGADVYIDNNYQGRVAESGELRISNKLGTGEHLIRATKDGFEPAQLKKNLAAGNEIVQLTLKRIAFSEEFSDFFQDGITFWEAPQTWKAMRGKMTVTGPEAGLMRDRVYGDFQMVFDISFANAVGAAWILRARDKQNYYLFQLTPTTFRSYVYQNGQYQLLKSDPVVEDLSRANDSFTITIEAIGPIIKHFIQVKSAPKAEGPQPLSAITNTVFPYGRIGFGTKDNETFVVNFVNVTPKSK